MSILFYISLSIVLILIGAYSALKILELKNKKRLKKKRLKNEAIFYSILDCIKNGKSQFKSRFMKVAYISINTYKVGNADIGYFLDTGDIVILKNNKVFKTTENVDKEIISDITRYINIIHGKDINDVVNFLGLFFSKKDFKKKFKMEPEEFNDILNRILLEKEKNETSDLDKIINKNKSLYNIDEILDKINSKGIDSLTEGEKEYLSDLSNN